MFYWHYCSVLLLSSAFHNLSVTNSSNKGIERCIRTATLSMLYLVCLSFICIRHLQTFSILDTSLVSCIRYMCLFHDSNVLFSLPMLWTSMSCLACQWWIGLWHVAIKDYSVWSALMWCVSRPRQQFRMVGRHCTLKAVQLFMQTVEQDTLCATMFSHYTKKGGLATSPL